MKPFVARLFVPGVLAVNAGLLLSLIFGPNSGRPNGTLLGVGIGVLVLGLLCMAIAGYHRRRDSLPPVRGA